LKKVIFPVAVIIIAVALAVVLYVKQYGLSYYNESLAADLFLNEHGVFDYMLLEERLNDKFGESSRRGDLIGFIVKHGGSCEKSNCKLSVFTTLCVSSSALISIDGESRIIVKGHTDGC